MCWQGEGTVAERSLPCSSPVYNHTMAPTRNKLSRADIRAILKSGKRIARNGLTLVYQETKKSASRFTVVIGVKTEKRATKRNRARRCLKEAIVGYLKNTPLLFDGVFFINHLPKTVTTKACAPLVSLVLEKTIHSEETKP